MTIEPLPQFRDLLRPETPAIQGLRPQTGSSPVAAHQFELYLKKAEPQSRPEGRVDTKSDTTDRPLPSRAERSEPPRRSAGKEQTEDRAERSSERSDDRDRIEDRRTEANDRADNDEAVEADDVPNEAPDEANDRGEEPTTGDQESGDDDDLAVNQLVETESVEVAVDAVELLSGLVNLAAIDEEPAAEAETVDTLAESAEIEVADPAAGVLVGADLAEAETPEAMPQDEADAPDLTDETATTMAVALPGQVAEEENIEGADDAVDTETVTVETDQSAVETDQSVVETAEAADVVDESTAGPGDDGTDGEAAVEEAPVAAAAVQNRSTGIEAAALGVARVDRSQPTNLVNTASTNPVARVDGPQTTTSRMTAPNAAGATADTGPVIDGEPGDPLWMQVRRAMNSLRALENGDQQVTIRLRPAELGSVMVRVAAGETQTLVSLVADSTVAANQLAQQRQQLIDELEQSGMLGVAVDVGSEQGSDRGASAQSADDSDNNGSANPGSGVASTNGNLNLNRTVDELIGAGRRRASSASAGALIDLDL